MAEAANNLFKSMDGWWVSGGDQAKVLGQLRGKSAEEIAEIRKSYADHFPGHDLDADIGKNLGKEQLKEAKTFVRPIPRRARRSDWAAGLQPRRQPRALSRVKRIGEGATSGPPARSGIAWSQARAIARNDLDAQTGRGI